MYEQITKIGGFEREVLTVVHRQAGKAYGVSIAEGIKADTGREPSSGAIYTALDRLSKKGFVSSKWGDPSPERGGRRKRFYQLEAAGAAALNCSFNTNQATSMATWAAT
nr:PadR family transcriptional regulator [uncultured Brevundimonas sp.]